MYTLGEGATLSEHFCLPLQLKVYSQRKGADFFPYMVGPFSEVAYMQKWNQGVTEVVILAKMTKKSSMFWVKLFGGFFHSVYAILVSLVVYSSGINIFV